MKTAKSVGRCITAVTVAPIAALTAYAILLSVRITTEAPKQGVGTLLGAVGGALAGSQVGKGRGRLVAVAAGTILGAFGGAEIGRSLDWADRIALPMPRSKPTSHLLARPVNGPIPTTAITAKFLPPTRAGPAAGAIAGNINTVW